MDTCGTTCELTHVPQASGLLRVEWERGVCSGSKTKRSGRIRRRGAKPAYADWKSAIGSLAPARSVLRTFALRANPFCRPPERQKSAGWKPAVRFTTKP
jgi:hypothetical protein